MPGVVHTGPFNAHFVRDIGAAYVVCGTALLWSAIRPAAGPAAQIAATFLALHAFIHFWDAAAGRAAAHQLLVEGPAVFLPPVLAIWIAWHPVRAPPSQQPRSEAR